MSNLITPGRPSEYGQVIIPNIEITGPRLLVKPKPRREIQTDTGIVIPPYAQEFSAEGAVILTGDGVMLADGTVVPPRVEQGQAIIYARYAGTELTVEDEVFLIIQEADIRCILTYKGKLFTIADKDEGDGE